MTVMVMAKARRFTDNPGIPPRCLVDSGVFMRALELDRPKWAGKPETLASRRFWETAIKVHPTHDDAILLSSITVLEFSLDPKAPQIPEVFGVEYVAFDRATAADMATWCSPRTVDAVAKATGVTRTMVKYDALIVACARVHRAAMVIMLDTDVIELSRLAGLQVKGPGDFGYQRGLFDSLDSGG
jgi:predicted nucleic acid-binding protein